MKWDELKKIAEAPASGQMLIYTRLKVVFAPYKNLKDVQEVIESEEVLEMHLFDTDKEYRCIATESKRYVAGFIEHIADFKADEAESVYKETVLLEDGCRLGGESGSDNKLTVLNHISYGDTDSDGAKNQNGMAIIDDYRLVGGM